MLRPFVGFRFGFGLCPHSCGCSKISLNLSLAWKLDREGTIYQKEESRSCLGESHYPSTMSNIQAQYFPRKQLFIRPTNMGVADEQPLAPPQGKHIG
jgi:hypothetical protein